MPLQPVHGRAEERWNPQSRSGPADRRLRSAVQHFANDRQQFARPERLHDGPALGDPVVAVFADDRIVGIAGHQDDGYIGTRGCQKFSKLRSTELRHDHVAQDKVDAAALALNEPARFVAVGSGQDGVPASLERRRSRAQDGVVVFDNQDGFASQRSLDRRGRCGGLARLFERPRQQDLGGRPDADLAVDRQAAARLGDDSVTGRESKTGSPAPLLGREERIEDPADM